MKTKYLFLFVFAFIISLDCQDKAWASNEILGYHMTRSQAKAIQEDPETVEDLKRPALLNRKESLKPYREQEGKENPPAAKRQLFRKKRSISKK